MTILVTGAAGFIGGHVVDALLARGDAVIGFDDLNDYYDPKIKRDTVAQHKKHKQYTFYDGDIRDKKALANVFSENKITSVIHLAARAGVRASIAAPELYFSTNVLGTLYVLELAVAYNVRNVVAASSSSVYGNSTVLPLSEDLKTDSPVSPYAASKVAMEALCHSYSHLHKLPITCLRFFTVYGPRGRPDMAPLLFIDAITKGKPITVFGDGTTSRDYTYVADTVTGVLAAHDTPRNFEVINLGNNKPVTLREFISTLENVTGKKAVEINNPLQPGDVLHTAADTKKAKKLLGYAPKTSLHDGLAATYRWYVSK